MASTQETARTTQVWLAAIGLKAGPRVPPMLTDFDHDTPTVFDSGRAVLADVRYIMVLTKNGEALAVHTGLLGEYLIPGEERSTASSWITRQPSHDSLRFHAVEFLECTQRRFGLSGGQQWSLWFLKDTREAPRSISNHHQLLTALSDFERGHFNLNRKLWTSVFFLVELEQPQPVFNPGTMLGLYNGASHRSVSKSKGRPRILKGLDTDVGAGDVLEGDLNAVLPTSISPTDEQWEEACSLFVLNPEEHKDPTKRTIRIPHSEIFLSPRQWWTVFQILTCREKCDLAGGILADVPGTGKTYITLGVPTSRSLIFHSAEQVKKDWEAKTGIHSPRTAKGNRRCRCNNQLGIECYGNPGGITRRIADTASRGAALIQVPNGVIEDWKQAIIGAKLNTTYFHPIVFHSNTPRELAPPADLKMQLRTSVAPESEKTVYSREFQPEPKDLKFTYTITEKHKAPERYIFLTTHDTTKLQEAFQLDVHLPIEPPLSEMELQRRGRKTVKRKVFGCPVGVHLVDEFHKVKHSSSPVVKAAHDFRHIRGDEFDFWSVTGTPFPDSLMDLQTTIDILHRPTWEDASHRHHGRRVTELRRLEGAYNNAIGLNATEAHRETFRGLAARYFSRDLVLRNVEDTKFFGKAITKIKAVKPELNVDFTPTEFVNDVQAVASGVADALKAIHPDAQKAARTLAGYQTLAPLQMLSTFPGAARLMLQKGVDFSAASLRAEIAKLEDRSDVSQVLLFQEHLDAVVEGSKKLDFILEATDILETDEELRPEQKVSEEDAKKPWFVKNDRRLKKMVVLTPSVGEAIFLYLAMRKLKPSSRPVLFHHDLKSSEKNDILGEWHSLRPDAKHRVLIAPFDLGGTGLNLQSANYEIVTGALRFKADELQGFRRTNREGQQLRVVHFQLLTEDNPHDRLIIARQAKKTIASDPFSLETDLSLE